MYPLKRRRRRKKSRIIRKHVNSNINMDVSTTPPNKRHFCTIAAKEYLFKVLALYLSLRQNSDNYHLWICCMDDTTLLILEKMHLKFATPFPVSYLEDEKLLFVKQYRKMNEYCWTLKGSLLQYVLNKPNVDSAIYCDGDIFFFSDPEAIFTEWSNYSIFLCPQRDLDWVHTIYGTYQAGLIGFKRDEEGLAALMWWKTKCLEWCYAKPEMDKFGDQKYLDNIPSMFNSVKISNNLGVNAAPWNSIYNNNYHIYLTGNDIMIEKHKLIAFHFARMQIFNDSEFDLWTFVNLPMSGIIKSKVYLPYIQALRKAISIVRYYYNESLYIFFSGKNPDEAKTYFKYSSFRIFTDQFDEFYCLCTIVNNEYLIKGLALYYSLVKKLKNFNLWVCCTDDEAYSILKKMELKKMTVVHVNEIEDSDLLAVKPHRTISEYCLTLQAPFILYLLKKIGIASIIYCDPDMYFFHNPQVIIDSWKNYSIFMCKQRDNSQYEQIYGAFQSGLLGFRHDKDALAILNWWKVKCLDWCYTLPEPALERCGNQKYLDKVPLYFQGIKLIDHPGIGAAPWNLPSSNTCEVHKKNGFVYINDFKLIVYNFESMSIFDRNEYDLWIRRQLTFDNNIINLIYLPYFDDIKTAIQNITSLPEVNMEHFYCHDDVKSARNYFKY